jgi:beta-glucosidase
MSTKNLAPYLNENLDLDSRINDLLNRLTLDEKFQILTSIGRRRLYSTKPIKRLKINSFKMPDGPFGVAYHSTFKKNTRFPTTKSLTSTWNRSLIHQVGQAIANETRACKKHMILAPGINIDRTPLNGRTFEYYSEDPFLTKTLANQFVSGVQSKGIGACLKHYVANNQETNRMSGSSMVDERTLHEIYLRAFEGIVKESNPLAVMACYNKVNGVYGCENTYLIRKTLIDNWGFEGMVMSDWFATRPIETTEGCVKAGLTLEMPWPSRYKTKSLQKAYNDNKIDLETINNLVRRNLRVMMLTGVVGDTSPLPDGQRNTVEHQTLARKVAEEGMVLLKNEGNLLPLIESSIDRVALLGPNLKKKFGRILYGGSSAVVPPYEITPLEGMKEICKGKIVITNKPDEADISIIFAGLNHGRGKDSESSDRKNIQLPSDQIELIKETCKVNHQTVVVLISGSPLAMDRWLDDVPVVLQAWYGGMEAGRAIANVLFGKVNPSGKLPITFPRKLEDSPAHHSGLKRNYPGDNERNVYYDEGIFVGYRWFDENEIEPLFPFGFGKSYTTFEFGEYQLDSNIPLDVASSFKVDIEVENVGQREGFEIVQVYARENTPTIERPPKELVGFSKVSLQPGEKREVSVDIALQDMAFFDVNSKDWRLNRGVYEIIIAQSSRHPILTDTITLT